MNRMSVNAIRHPDFKISSSSESVTSLLSS